MAGDGLEEIEHSRFSVISNNDNIGWHQMKMKALENFPTGKKYL